MAYRQMDPETTVEDGREYVSRQFLENERDNFLKNRNKAAVGSFLLGGATVVLACCGEWAGATLSCGGSALCHRLFQLNKRNFGAMRDYLDRHPGVRVPIPADPQ